MKEKVVTIVSENNQEKLPDIKAEVLAASWLDEGLSAERLLMRPLGQFKRKFSHDIGAVQGEGELNRFRGRILELNRSGVYDHLPESLLHLRTQPTPTVAKKVADVKREREKEKKSRLFFLPLEQEIFLAKIQNEQRESKAFHLRPGGGFLKILREFWQIPAFVPEDWLLPLIAHLPRLGRGATAQLPALSEALLGNLTGCSVSLRFSPSRNFRVDSPWCLSQSCLGEQTLLGGNLASYCPHYALTLKVQSESESPYIFLPGGSGRAALEWLLGFLLPAEAGWGIRTEAASTEFLLADDSAAEPRLGNVCL